MDEKQSSKTRGKPIKCRAAVVRQPGEPSVIEEIMVAPPMAREVRVRIICTSPSRTDISFWEMKDEPAIFPRILGHEAMGLWRVPRLQIKKEQPMFKPPFQTISLMPRHETSRFTDLNGEVLYHFLSVSSFSEYTVVDIAHVTKIDPSIPPNRACLLSCEVSTGVGSAWRTANVETGSTVAIFGLGSIGLAVAEGARLCGATKIIGVDLNPDKFEVGKKFGVTEFVNAGDSGNKTVSQVIKEITGGGADYCFECVGLASLVQEAYASCRKGWGKTIVLGADKPGSTLSLSSFDVVHSGKSLKGCLFGGIKAKTDIPILTKRYLDKELQLDEFVTHEVKFDDINKAFDLLIQGESLRCVIWMDK